MLPKSNERLVTAQDLTELIEFKGADAGVLGEDGNFHWNGSIQTMIDALDSQVDQPKP